MSTLSIAKSRNPKSAAPKKGSVKSNTPSRRKITSTAVTYHQRLMPGVIGRGDAIA